jgi:rod shape-determining protein MreC
MDVLGRYRNLIVLVGVLFAQVLGLAVQVKRTTDSEPTRLIRVWAVGMVTPLEKTLVWTKTSTSNLWSNYFYLRGVRAENRSLKAQIEQMRLEQVRMSQDADQARRLQALLGFKEQFISQTTAAQVIGGSGSDLSRLIYIDKGYGDGVRPDMAVITGDGIVGKVLRADRADRHVAQVLLIDDQTSGVGTILDKSRLQGILRGTPSGEVVLEKVMSDETVPVGELVLTSGGDGIFPKGLPVGRVTKVTPGSELFLNIHVHPAADLSKLEEVLVVTKIDQRQAEPDQTNAQRAADILAERLPTVPPKPVTVEKAPATTSAKPNTSSTGTTNISPGIAPGTATKKPPAPGISAPAKPVASGASAPANPANSNSGSESKPKTLSPPVSAANGTSTPQKTPASAPSPATSVKSSATGLVQSSAPASNAATAKVTPKPVKAAAQPQPQPAIEDTPH